jgi:hypothetical protein
MIVGELQLLQLCARSFFLGAREAAEAYEVRSRCSLKATQSAYVIKDRRVLGHANRLDGLPAPIAAAARRSSG